MIHEHVDKKEIDGKIVELRFIKDNTSFGKDRYLLSSLNKKGNPFVAQISENVYDIIKYFLDNLNK